ncbi:MAG TPA: TIGR00725 family protein [Spirochaetota bacterium]|nr:TIGR00725 family protein [Spirochaetota bacterium]
MRMRQVVVIGSGDDTANYNKAMAIGAFIAGKGWALVTGGRGGIMEAASRGAAEKKGIVIAILPDSSMESANPYCSIVIPTGIGYARNLVNVLSGDVIVAIGGKAGTLSELAYAWQFGKPVIACTFAEGWSRKLEDTPVDDRGGSIYFADSPEAVFRHLERILGNPAV